MFKQLSNLTSIMKQAQQMGSRMQELNDQLRSKRAEGTAGGGMVQVEVNGLGETLRVTIDPALVEKGEREMIEDLLPAAINEAQQKAKALHAEAMQSLTSDMDVPGLNEAIAKMTGGQFPTTS